MALRTSADDRTAQALPALAVLPVAPLQMGGDFLWLAIVFFVLAVVAGLAGFRGVAGLSMSIAKILIVVFLVLAIVALVL